MKKSRIQGHLPQIIISLLLTLGLLACGGGSTAPSNPIITAISAPTSTSVQVTFSKALGEGADVANNFQLKTSGGEALEVMAAYLDASETTVTLATQPQDLVDYSLQTRNLKAKDGQELAANVATGSFTGSNVVAPIVASAVPLSNTSVLITFSDPVTAQAAVMGESAADARFYRISNPDLAIEKAELQKDETTVILTTAEQSRESYTVQVSNVYSKEAKLLIDPFTNTASFDGIPPNDEDPPVISEVTATTNTSVLVRFSESVQDNATDTNNYVINSDSERLTVLEASLDSVKTTVTLKTAAQTQGASYTLEVEGLKDLSNNEIAKGSTKTFLGASATGTGSDTEPPRVLGASSLNNKSVVLTFSEAMDKDSAETLENYSLFGVNDGSLQTQAILIVQEAKLNSGGRSVTLTTLSQSSINYNVQVANVKDLAGNFIAPPDRDNPYVANFRGTAPSPSDFTDTDGDGLTDDVEQLGWTVIVTAANGDKKTYEVTSDPNKKDTDDDGLDDFTEKEQSFDPRNKDTDTDRLSDYAEYAIWYSKADIVDTDGDGIEDGYEIEVFKTNPTVPDTDGDGIEDGTETAIVNDSRRAVLSDLPRFNTVISSVDLKLDYRFNETTTQGTTQGTTQSTGTTTLKADTATRSQENSSSKDWFAKAGTEICWGGSCENGGFDLIGTFADFGVKFTAEAGGGGTTSFVSTEEDVRTVQNEYSKTLETSKEVSAETTLSREVVGATMQVAVTFNSQSDVSFLLKNLEFTAQILDPTDPTRYLPIGKLVPSADLVVDLGPKGSVQETKGPIIFSVENPVPSVVEALMQNPQGIIVRLANYSVEVRGERNFVFNLEDIANRTAFVEIDYAGRRDIERLNPATYAGFNEDTSRAKGITFKTFMEDILLLEHVEASPSADGKSCTETTEAAKLASTYSTCMITVGAEQTEALWRVREVSRSDNTRATSWWVLTPEDGLITPVPEYPSTPWVGKDFRSYVLGTNQAFALKFVVDEDFDGLEATLEAALGSSDKNVDSDGDGIQDGDEVYGLRDANGVRQLWTISLANGRSTRVGSNPARKDSDGDGLDDCQELIYGTCSTIQVYNGTSGPNLNAEGTLVASFQLPNRTDPTSTDTDKEGLPDGLEVAGFKGQKYNDSLQLIDYTLLPVANKPAINPLDTNSDTDVLNDFMELRLKTDPTVDDGGKVLDDDGDGLVNLEESLGWNVTVFSISTSPGVQGAESSIVARSDPKRADADGDGLNDNEEKSKGTHPSRPDTDGDGLNDKVDPYPNDADQDNDLLSDSEESRSCITGSRATQVNNPDSDGDGLLDGVECQVHKTNPNNPNTDGDSYTDKRDIDLGLDPLVKDRLFSLNLNNYFVETRNACEIGTGFAEFLGTIYVETAENPKEVIPLGRFPGWDPAGAGVGNRMTGPFYDPDTNAITQKIARIKLRENGPRARLYSDDIYEVDGARGNTVGNYYLGPITERNFAYEDSNLRDEEVVIDLGENTQCWIKIRYQITIIR